MSHYALGLLVSEMARGKKIEEKDCGYVMTFTHGLPCTCILKDLYENRKEVSHDIVHCFWTTLVIGQSHFGSQSVGSNHPSQEHEHFHNLIDEVRCQDPSVVGSINNRIHDELHPHEENIGEPAVKMNVKGRPKGSSSTRRIPSGWERRGRGSGRRGSARSEGSGKYS